MKKRLSVLLLMLCVFLAGWSQTRIEAEDFSLNGSASVGTDASLSGGKFVNLNEGSLSYTFTATEDAFFDIYIYVAYPSGEKYNNFVIDGNSGSFGSPETVIEYQRQKVGSFTKLTTGQHTFEITPSWGWITIDYIELEEVDPANRFSLNQALVTPNPTDEAQRLYQFLLDNYGRKIISGAMTLRDMDMITKFKNKFGKEPALAGIDFLFENQGYDWYQDGSVASDAQAWYERNGIPAICWHWIDPMKKGGSFYYLSNNYPDGTTFDAKNIFNEGTAEYNAMISDMDFIAGELKKLQTNGVPVVWRPLHEASGGWFWWGAQGPEACKKIWQVMFDRFVNFHGLKNLIWVWTHQAGESPEWYPGDEYVDIVGMDIYKTGDHTSQIMEFNNVNDVYSGKKIIAETECGSFPDPDNLIADGAAWSWFMPWYDSDGYEFLTGETYNPTSFWEKVIDHDYVIMLDEMPDLKNYTSVADDESRLEFLKSDNGVFKTIFDPATTEYTLNVPSGSSAPTISATALSNTAEVTISQANSVPGTATVKVVSGDKSTTSTYTITIAEYTQLASSILTVPASAEVYLNESQEFTATVFDQNGIEMPASTSWSINDGGDLSAETGSATTFTSNGAEGEYTITVKAGNLTETVAVTVTEAPILTILEAELFTMADGAEATVLATASNGKIGSLNEGSMSYTFTTDEDGIYDLSVFSASPYGEKENTLTLDGTDYTIAQTNLEYEMIDVAKAVALSAGEHSITISSSWGWINIDYVQLQLKGANKLSDIIEAEYFTLTDGAATATLASASNGEIVKLNEGNMSYTFDTKSEAYYDFYIYSASPNGDKQNNFVIDGSAGTFSQTDGTEYVLIKAASFVKLAAGEHTMQITNSWGWIDIDYIKLEEVDPSSRFDLTQTLCTPDPTPEAQSMFKFLLDNYGKKIISGVMTLNSMDMSDKILAQTGKSPALLGIDFMQSDQAYTWYDDHTPRDDAETWYNKNGIPAMCWHWRDPSTTQGEFYTKTTDKPNGTEFDASKIFDNTSAEYAAMIEDIDFVAEEFKYLQEKGVAVVWRPLHEASGGWFWWGAKGPEACVELWKVMYDRLVNYHDIRNLIWTWTYQSGEDFAWYPGDEYVDIVGMDIYKTGDHSSQIIDFNNANNVYSGKKMIAETECGSFPDADNLIADGAAWSWFMTWYDSPGYEFTTGETYNPATFWDKTVAHDYVITLDEMPNLRTYGQTDAKQTISLQAGWNLVSTYLTPANPATETAFSCASVVKNFEGFYTNDQEAFLNSLKSIKAGDGYLVYVENDCDASISGSEFTPSTVTLSTGWNIIGYPFKTDKTVEAALASISNDILVVKTFDSQWAPSGSNTLTELQSGKAYFIKVSKDCTLNW